ncbi:MAG: TadE/TadG family type IV pilus assembly protein [Bryobacterales bacterium]|nr:TadE/TadG family type IV pilus assembly protein [Bryobacterales bacterium]
MLRPAGRGRRQRGAFVVEAALIMLPFLFLIFGIIEFGVVTRANNFVSYAAREGTRYASVRGADSGVPASATQISNFVKGHAVGLNASNLTVATTWVPDNKRGSSVRVQVSYSMSGVTGLILPGIIRMRSTSQTVIYQ